MICLAPICLLNLGMNSKPLSTVLSAGFLNISPLEVSVLSVKNLSLLSVRLYRKCISDPAIKVENDR